RLLRSFGVGLSGAVALFALHAAERLVRGDRRPAGFFVPGDVAAHAVEVELLELARQGRVGARVGGPVPHVLRGVVAVLADVDAYVPALSLGKLGRFAIGEGDLVVLVDAPIVRLHSLINFRVFAHARANFDERIAEEAARFRFGGGSTCRSRARRRRARAAAARRWPRRRRTAFPRRAPRDQARIPRGAALRRAGPTRDR